MSRVTMLSLALLLAAATAVARDDEPMRDPPVAATLVKSVAPKYPEEARSRGIQGVVLLELLVERNGRVSAGKVLKPLPFGLTQAAIDCVQQWRYKPAENRRGWPVRSVVVARVRFEL